jgi:ankyrin repeat protein
MPLSDLPTELLIDIATHLQVDVAAMNALACTNKNAYNLFNDRLYYRDLTQSQSSSLTWAAENGVEGTIQRAIDVVAIQNLNPLPISFLIAIQVAARRGHVPIVELLLKFHGNNINPNYLLGSGNGVESFIQQKAYYQDLNPILNALQVAALQGHVPIVELLLKLHDINPNFRGGSLKAAPLHLATQKGHSAIVELLLAVPKIDPDVRERDCTPLIYACQKGHVSIVQQLLARNDVDVNARGSHYGSGYRCTPLIIACKKGHVEIINLLLAKDGVDINLAYTETPFIAAARMGLMEVVESLLARADFDPNIVTDSGVYALGDAAHEGNVDVMKLLLDHPDVDPNFAGGYDGTTPLILGSRFPDVVKLLLDQQGIDVNSRENSDDLRTALIEAVCDNCVESAKLLLEREDININIPDSEGWTALHWACHEMTPEVVDLLLGRNDIDLNPRDVVNWKTPLAFACRIDNCRNIPIIRSLLSHRNTDPNILNINGDSILADFMKYRHEMESLYADEIESLLRNAGALEILK